MDENNIEKIEKEFPLLNDIKRLPGGGQKDVFKAFHKKYKDIVLKFIKPSHSDYERTIREIRATKIIDSKNIPKIYETNIEKEKISLIWLIEQYISGQTLREHLKSDKKFTINEVVKFIETLLEIIKKAEEKKIVHRDIKPENIILDTKGEFWLIDFGIARHLDLESLTDTNAPFALCTLGYAASEQFRNRKKEIDSRTDLFAIGVVAIEMIIGTNPYRENTNDPLQIMKNVEKIPLPMVRIEGDSQYLHANFIKTIGDNRISRRPNSAIEAYDLFISIKPTLKL